MEPASWPVCRLVHHCPADGCHLAPGVQVWHSAGLQTLHVSQLCCHVIPGNICTYIHTYMVIHHISNWRASVPLLDAYVRDEVLQFQKFPITRKMVPIMGRASS